MVHDSQPKTKTFRCGRATYAHRNAQIRALRKQHQRERSMNKVPIIGEDTLKPEGIDFSNYSLETTINRLVCEIVALDSQMSEGGIHLPDKANTKFLVCRVVKCGPSVEKIQVGDLVYPNPQLALMLMVQGKQYCICREVEVLVHLRKMIDGED